MAEVENTISRDSLEISNVQTRIERLGKIMDQLDEEIAQKNEIISRSEQEIVKRNAIIERKQNIIDQYNKRLEVLISKAGVREHFFLFVSLKNLAAIMYGSPPFFDILIFIGKIRYGYVIPSIKNHIWLIQNQFSFRM